MRRVVGSIVLALSACGYPLTQFVIRRYGVRGAAVAEAACVGLAVRDASMVAAGLPVKLRAVPAALLRLELVTAVAASVAGLHPLLRAPAGGAPSERAGAADAVRRVAVATLFAVHTIRFGIYLQPGSGRRVAPESGARRQGFVNAGATL